MRIKLFCFIAMIVGCSDPSLSNSDNNHCVQVGLNLTRAFNDFYGDAGQQGRYNDDYSCAVLNDAQLSGIDFSSPYIPYGPHGQYPVCETGFTSPPQLCLTNLKNANMARINLSGANLSRVVLHDANLQGAILNRALLYGTELYRANLSGANLTEANLTDAKLSDAVLVNANLSRTTLTGANLTGVNLTGAILLGANLRGANLDRAIGVDYTGALR
jgi:uncharacterized protein YjbI with pentapeptide repeats